MPDQADSVLTLYNTFILRDILSYFLPGVIILISLYYLITPGLTDFESLISRLMSMTGIFFVIGAALAYLVGFALGCLAEAIGLVTQFSGRHYINDKDYYKHGLIPFLRKSSRTEYQQYERFVMLKQTSVNGFMAFLITACIFIGKYIQYPAVVSNLFFALGAVVFSSVLMIGYAKYASRLEDWREAVKEIVKEP
jgi:Sec-independent protein secretion pathway component TatC